MNSYYCLSHCCTVATLHVCSHVHIVSCLQMRNVHYVRASLSFDWSVCMYPGCTGCRKSQMSMLSSCEPLTIWKSSNCRPYTTSECSCDKVKGIVSHGQATQIKCLHMNYVMAAKNVLVLYLGRVEYTNFDLISTSP